MKTITIISVLILFLIILSVGVIAPTEALLTGVNVNGSEISITIEVNRGIDTGARNGNSPFHLVISLMYPEIASNIVVDVPVNDTIFVKYVNSHTAEILTSVNVDTPPTNTSNVVATVKIVAEPDNIVLK